MKNLLIVLAIAAAVSFSGIAMAAKAGGLKGKISKIDGTKITVTHKGEDVVVVTDDSTKVKINGEDATFADLKVGQHVTVTPETGTATMIEVKGKKSGKSPTTGPAN